MTSADDFSSLPDGLSAELERLRALTCAKWTWHPADVLPAWVADMDLPPVPAAVDAVRALVERGDFGYNMTAEFAIPSVFVERQERLFGWTPDKERTRVLCDVMQGVQMAVWLGTKPGDGIVVFTPVYPPFLSTVEKSGRRIIECPLEAPGWKLDPAQLEAVIDDRTTAILTCDPHNPTGRAFSAEELGAIAEVAGAHDLLVISDEIWADLTHEGVRHIPFASISDDAVSRTITLNAASKAFNLAGLRTAVAHIGSERLAAAIAEIPGHVFGAVGSPGAEATLAAWTCGDEWLVATRAHLTAMRDHLASRLAEELPEVGFTLPEATYLAWLDFRELGLGDDPAKALLERGRVALSSGLDFGPRGAGYARLNFATTRPILDAVFDRIVAHIRAR